MFPSAWQFVLLVMPLASGQLGLQTISVIGGQTKSTSATASPSSSPLPSSSSSSSSLPSTTAVASGTSLSTATTTDDPLVLTTIFTQPTDCSTGITEIEAWSTFLWQNIINPVPTLTLSSCYPSQLYYSAVATEVLPPFKQLVCPLNWETYDINSTYIICCPRKYGIYLPNYNNTERPGLGAVCTSMIWPSVLMDITSYDATALATTIATIAGSDGTLVLATAFDGTLATYIATSESGSVSGSSKTSSISSASSSAISSTPTSSSASSTTISAGPTAISQLPACGQTCFGNMLAQYSTLGCSTPDPSCLCKNVNFGYGIRDCSNGACGSAVASTVIAFESSYCSSALAAPTTH